jgi:hypothetical protein
MPEGAVARPPLFFLEPAQNQPPVLARTVQKIVEIVQQPFGLCRVMAAGDQALDQLVLTGDPFFASGDVPIGGREVPLFRCSIAGPKRHCAASQAYRPGASRRYNRYGARSCPAGTIPAPTAPHLPAVPRHRLAEPFEHAARSSRGNVPSTAFRPGHGRGFF